MARECYLVSIQPLVEQAREHELKGPPQAKKLAKIGLATVVLEALVIHTLTSTEPHGLGQRLQARWSKFRLKKNSPSASFN